MKQPRKEKPFIYIASLRRTGSKVLSEALSLLPYSYVFREPRLGSGKFKIRPVDIATFKEHDIELNLFEEQISRMNRNKTLKYFKGVFMPALLRVSAQIGIKEIHHKNWKNVYRLFPDMKVILTARDPRDIYLSLYYKSKDRNIEINVGGDFSSHNVAENLEEDFRYQIEMLNTMECFKVRYEDLCTDPSIMTRVKRFVESDIPGIGMIGKLSKWDHQVHGYQITDKRIYRWKNENDRRLLSQAQEVFDNLTDYCKFWGYSR